MKSFTLLLFIYSFNVIIFIISNVSSKNCFKCIFEIIKVSLIKSFCLLIESNVIPNSTPKDSNSDKLSTAESNIFMSSNKFSKIF